MKSIFTACKFDKEIPYTYIAANGEIISREPCAKFKGDSERLKDDWQYDSGPTWWDFR